MPSMESITRNVRDIKTSQRHVLEDVLGRPLLENQQLLIKIVELDGQGAGETEKPRASGSGLPDWCNVYEGLNDREIADVEEVILQRSDLSRPSE